MRFEIRRRVVLPARRGGRGRGSQRSALVLCANPEDRDMLLALGRPFVAVPNNAKKVGLVLTDMTEWREVRELVTDSYCLLAPKKLVALLDLPPEG